MAIISLATIKNWFKTGLKPSQAQFWDTWDSFRHKSEAVPAAEIDGLDHLLLTKASQEDLDYLAAVIDSYGNVVATPTLQEVTTKGATTNKALFIDVVGGYSPALIARTTAATGIHGASGTGVGIVGESSTGKAAVFNIDDINTSNIIEFQKNSVNQAYVTHDGILIPKKVIINDTVDNGVDKLQVNGTVSGSPATLSNQFVTKAQLDLKSNIIVSEYAGNGVSGNVNNNILKSYLIPSGTFKTNDFFNILVSLNKGVTLGSVIIRTYLNSTVSLTGATLLSTYTYATTTKFGIVERSHICSPFSQIFGLSPSTSAITDRIASTLDIVGMNFDYNTPQYFIVAMQTTNAGDTSYLGLIKLSK